MHQHGLTVKQLGFPLQLRVPIGILDLVEVGEQG